MEYERWASLSEAELADVNVAEVNLAAAVGLPGAEGLDIPTCLAKLDEWAALVHEATEHFWPKFVASPPDVARFRMLMVSSVLQHNFGVRYDSDAKAPPFDAWDARRILIHGPLENGMGTCANLPVLYLAIGRRLGYSLWLVEAKSHFFIRWEDADDRFNVECTTEGFGICDDDHYRTFPFPIDDDEVARGRYLRNMSRREELASFLSERGCCLLDHLRFDGAITAFRWAARINPRHEGGLNLATAMRAIFIRLQRQGPVDKQRLPSLIDACSPPARTRYERLLLAKAKEELLRLLPNPAETFQRTIDESFAAWEGEQADLFPSLNKKPRSSRCMIRR
jgi:hypothetical protein